MYMVVLTTDTKLCALDISFMDIMFILVKTQQCLRSDLQPISYLHISVIGNPYSHFARSMPEAEQYNNCQ